MVIWNDTTLAGCCVCCCESSKRGCQSLVGWGNIWIVCCHFVLQQYKNKHFLLFVEIYLFLHLDCPKFPNKNIKWTAIHLLSWQSSIMRWASDTNSTTVFLLLFHFTGLRKQASCFLCFNPIVKTGLRKRWVQTKFWRIFSSAIPPIFLSSNSWTCCFVLCNM